MLPTITIELRHLRDDTYESRILDPQQQDILRCEFTFNEDDPFFVRGTRYLEEDGQRKNEHVEPGFIQRMGKHFYDLITDGKDDFKNYLRLNNELKGGFCLTLALDSKTIKEKPQIKEPGDKKDTLLIRLIEALHERQKTNPEGIERLSNHADLLWRIPWEYLHDGDEFLALSGKAYLTRKPIGLGELAVVKSPQPLRLLVVVSRPNRLPELNSEKEIGVIQEAIDSARRNGWLEIDYLETATLSNLRSKIKHFQPHILHYSGHGGKLPFSNETYLAFEDDYRELKPLFGDDLRRITADSESLQLIVLSGCMTAQTHHRDALKGIGTALLQDSLPAVLAMQYSILDESGIEFASKFYEELSQGSSVLEAVNEVRLRLYDLRGKDRADWGLPALYLRTPEIHLIDTTMPPTPQTTKPEQVDIGGLPVVRGFVGRKNEIMDIRQAIDQPQMPAVYIYGLGGVGKTALTAKVIEKVKQDKAVEAVCVIRCDKIEPTFANVIEKMANFISFQGKEGHARAGQLLKESSIAIDERISLLNNTIKDFRYLFIFDNFESLFIRRAPCGELRDEDLTWFFSSIFDHNWHSTFVFTCRYEWQLLSEKGLPVKNLLTIHLPGLTRHQTIQHMNNLAGPLSRLEYEEQSQLLPLIQGHPKTVELLDSYLKIHTVSQVLEDENLRDKITEDIGTYFMDGLWQDLNTDEQEALGILAVFRSPLTAQDIQRLVPKKEALNKLTGYSLLQLEGEGKGYVVHPVVSEYVLAKIGKEECKKLHKKASELYIYKYDDLLKSVPEEIRTEHLEVLCEVMEMLAQRGMREQADAMANSLLEIHHHLFEAGEYEQAHDIVNAIQPFLDMQGRQELSKELLKKSINSLEGFGRYVAMSNLALLLNREGKWQKALESYQECHDFFKSKDAKSQMATAIGQQALIYRQQGKYEQALKLERKALALYKDIDGEEKIAIAIEYYRITQLLHVMEKYEEALKQGEKALELDKELGNQEGIARALHQLGLTLNALNRPNEAFKHFTESLAISEQIGAKAGQADSLSEIGKLLLRARQFKEALDCFQWALNIRRALGDPVKVAISLEALGVVFEDQGHYEEALIKYQEALQLEKQYGSPQGIAITERNIARVKRQM
ncbi:MAG: tetratricopeptide repeat protein [Methanophagales archaeon]|nr:tetratricopeptide repeat protein [Methanophagales archaeon]